MSDHTDQNNEAGGSVLNPSRKRCPEKWKKCVKKAKRDSGESYVSPRSGVVAEKKPGPPCSCNNLCYNKVGVDNIKLIFDGYWGLGNHDAQSNYILCRVSDVEAKRSRVKGRESRRKKSRVYTVMLRNTTYTVCMQAFINMHAISEKRVRNVMAKAASSPTGTLTTDQRGRKEPPNKTSQDTLNLVQDFCKSLPTCQSHYSRAKNPDRLYLPPGSTWNGLFIAFQDFLEEKGLNRDSITERRFTDKVKEYKISIHPPRSDTCAVCDEFKMKLQELSKDKDQDKITELTIKKNEHQVNALVGRKFIDIYKKDTNPGIAAIAVDLQQTLPTPKLTVSAQYYRCKLWTYNLGIHDLKTNHPYFYVWHEAEAKRGSIEVASCINHFVKNYLGDEVLKLVVFSDNCAGQNKNINLVLSYLRLVHTDRFSSVHHYFLETGHSYLPCDRDFGVLEKHLRSKEVFTTDHYIECMKACRKKDPATVVRMTSDDFLNFSVLQKFINKGGQTAAGFRSARRIIASNDFTQGVTVCRGYGDSLFDPYKWNLQKGPARARINFDLSTVAVPKMYPSGVIINKKKLQHIKFLANYVPTASRPFFNDLFASQDGVDVVDRMEEDDDPDDDFLEY